MLVDSHCHLNMETFIQDVDAVVARAHAAGVERLVTICTRVDEFAAAVAIAERFESVYCSVGIHPHEVASDEKINADRLVSLARHPKNVAIGETGLDYYYENSPRDMQQRSFRVHIEASRRTGLPLVIHSRQADDDMEMILREESGKGAFSAVLHCFSSGQQLAHTAIELGMYVSLSGIVTFSKAGALRKIVAGLPVERLIVETDAPYLAPVPHRGKRNEPAFVVHTAAKMAELLGMDECAFARQTSDNFYRLFSKVERT